MKRGAQIWFHDMYCKFNDKGGFLEFCSMSSEAIARLDNAEVAEAISLVFYVRRKCEI